MCANDILTGLFVSFLFFPLLVSFCKSNQHAVAARTDVFTVFNSPSLPSSWSKCPVASDTAPEGRPGVSASCLESQGYRLIPPFLSPLLFRSVQKFHQRCLWKVSDVRLIDDGPLSSFQGRSSSVPSCCSRSLVLLGFFFSIVFLPINGPFSWLFPKTFSNIFRLCMAKTFEDVPCIYTHVRWELP